jgi:glycosyltransferase involved in cell wall biosynthesis
MEENTMKKLLFTFYIPSGGVETLNRQRSAALKDTGMEIHFLYLKRASGLQNSRDDRTFVTNENDKIAQIILREKYDAIIVCLDYLFVNRLRKLGYEGMIIYDVQGFGNHIDELMKHAAESIPKHADAVLYPKTPHLHRYIQSHFPTLPKFSFHNCIDLSTFSYRTLPKETNPVIGWVGRLEENKRWEDFLKIGARIIKMNPNIELWMFHDPSLATSAEKKIFKQLTKHLGIEEKLQVFSNVPHHKMADYYSMIGDSGGFLCSTSKYEGFGYAVLEAMSCRCPVLTTDSDGVKSFITHNKTGKFFDHGNIQQALQEAKDYLGNHALREAIRTTASKHVENHFSVSQYRQNFTNMLKNLRN